MDEMPPPSPTPADTTLRFYVDAAGVYLGGFLGTPPPEEAIEVSHPPLHAKQPWDAQTQQWLPVPFDDEDFAAQVTRERDRRIASGVLFEGVLYQSRATDRENIAGAAQLAFMARAVGQGDEGDFLWDGTGEPFEWIAADNSMVPMDAPTVIALAKTAAAMKQAYTKRARAIKDMDPPPADIKDDALWSLEP